MDKFERRRLRLVELRDKHCDGVTSALARRMGKEQSYVARLLYPAGKDGKKRIGDDMIDVIEQAFALPRGWLDNLHMNNPSASFQDVADLPELHYCAVTNRLQFDGSWGVVNMEAVEGSGGHVFYPAMNEQCYAVQVVGDHLRPRVRHGEYLVLDPKRRPEPGDDALIQLVGGARVFREVMYIRDGDLTVQSADGTSTISDKDIVAMHYVAAIIPRGGFQKG